MHARRYRQTILATSLVALTSALAQGCADGRSSQGVELPNGVGAVNLALTAGDGLVINTVHYVVKDASGSTVLDSSVDVSDPQATFYVRLTLKAGTGYSIEMDATTTSGVACAGSATFDVVAHTTQQVSVDLLCAGENNGNDTGDVVINGTVTPGSGDSCPDVAFLSAAPLTTSVGGSVSLHGGASSQAAGVVVGWTATGGTLAASNAADTTFTCTAVGTETLTFTVSDGASCTDSSTVQVTCLAADSDAGATVVDSGSSEPDAGSSQDSGSSEPDAGSADGGTTEPDAGGPLPPRDVTIRFKAEVNGAAFACGTTYENTGSTNATSTPSDFRFFVQSVALINTAGVEVPVTLATRGSWQTPDVGLIDFEDGTGDCVSGNAGTNTELTGTVPAGDYNGIVLVNGIPEPLNHGDPATAPAPILNAPNSAWSWLAGYKFIMAELAHPETFGLGLYHVGATGCSGSPQAGNITCAKPNRNRVQLSGFNPDTNVVVADIGVVMSQIDLTADNQCHSSGSTCASGFSALGINFANGQALSTAPAFHVE